MPASVRSRTLILLLMTLAAQACAPSPVLDPTRTAAVPASLTPAPVATMTPLPPSQSPSPSPTLGTDTPPTLTPVPPSPTATDFPTATPGSLAPTVLGRAENLELVGRHDLGQAGWHAGLALAYPCAYIGNRRVPHIAILDVSDAAQPELAGHVTLAPGSQPIELRAVADLGLLVVLNFSPQATLLTYDVSNCRQPMLLSALALGAMPHEFFLWRDPLQPARLLAYAAMWSYQRPDLHVVDLSDPAAPRRLGGWTSAGDAPAGSLHSLSVSPDGRLAYLAMWEGGFLMADVSDFALGLPEPRLRLLRDEAGLAPAPGQAVHSALPLADPRYVLLTEEVYTCPFAGLMVADTLQPARPTIVGRFELPENDRGCTGLPRADAVFTAHNPLVVGRLAFVTWYGGGLQVLDLADPTAPRRVGMYVPDGQGAAERSYVGGYPAQLWSYPVLRQGLLYVADIQSGMHILRYTGPGASDINGLALAEGNVTVLP